MGYASSFPGGYVCSWERWAPTIVINGVMGPYKWPKIYGFHCGYFIFLVSGVELWAHTSSWFSGAHLVTLSGKHVVNCHDEGAVGGSFQLVYKWLKHPHL